MKCGGIPETEEQARNIMRGRERMAKYHSSTGYRFLKEVAETVEVVGVAATTLRIWNMTMLT